MAGKVRQPIDLKALEKYVEEHVQEIKTPFDLKQVSISNKQVVFELNENSLDLVNPTQLTRSQQRMA